MSACRWPRLTRLPSIWSVAACSSDVSSRPLPSVSIALNTSSARQFPCLRMYALSSAQSGSRRRVARSGDSDRRAESCADATTATARAPRAVEKPPSEPRSAALRTLVALLSSALGARLLPGPESTRCPSKTASLFLPRSAATAAPHPWNECPKARSAKLRAMRRLVTYSALRWKRSPQALRRATTVGEYSFDASTRYWCRQRLLLPASRAQSESHSTRKPLCTPAKTSCCTTSGWIWHTVLCPFCGPITSLPFGPPAHPRST
mmetsp:Transcript_30997/g.82191  ORF Transcript_30997/g.82191 Transcript_30997/m.82191 type:complete len:263 (-) Transcript_30997:706-1494(-)